MLHHITIKKPDYSVLAALVLALSLIFLQEGYTYYLSFQILALVFIGVLVFSSTYSIKINKHFLIAFLAFSLSVSITAVVSPTVIAKNFSNIFLTVIALLAYAFMIGCFLNLKPKRVGLVLEIFKYASAMTVLTLVSLMVLSDLDLVHFLTRESLLIQNSRLIDNFTAADAIMTELEYLYRNDLSVRVDLFYGEPSYLAIVMFTCVACYMLTSSLVADLRNDCESTYLKSYPSGQSHRLVVVIGIFALLYIKSLSSIIYALVVVYYALIKQDVRRRNLFMWISILTIIAIAFAAFSYGYLLHRITQTDSLSLSQRFGFLLDFGIYDYLFGIKDGSRLPDVGIHNGLFYIISIAGFAGIWYIIFLLRAVYSLSKPIKMSLFLSLLVLAIMMQNGGVFSPNKVVLLSSIFIPLSCVRPIYSRQHLNTINSRRHEKASPFPLA